MYNQQETSSVKPPKVVNSEYAPNDPDRIRSVFVGGLPMDVTVREFHVMFLGCPGFEGSLLRATSLDGKPTSPVGFATFATRFDCMHAIRNLNGKRFHKDCAQVLRVELAHKTTNVVCPVSPPSSSHSTSESSESSTEHSPPASLNSKDQLSAENVPESAMRKEKKMKSEVLIPLSDALKCVYHAEFDQRVAQLLKLGRLDELVPDKNNKQKHMTTCQPVQSNPVPANSTLFVANITKGIVLEDLEHLLRGFEGFQGIRYLQKNGPRVAFVDFESVEIAREAREVLREVSLAANGTDMLRVEYARKRMAVSQ